MSELYYKKIKTRLLKHDISIGKLCEETGVSRSTLANWRNKNPSSVECYLLIEDYLNGLDAKISS